MNGSSFGGRSHPGSQKTTREEATSIELFDYTINQSKVIGFTKNAKTYNTQLISYDDNKILLVGGSYDSFSSNEKCINNTDYEGLHCPSIELFLVETAQSKVINKFDLPTLEVKSIRLPDNNILFTAYNSESKVLSPKISKVAWLYSPSDNKLKNIGKSIEKLQCLAKIKEKIYAVDEFGIEEFSYNQ